MWTAKLRICGLAVLALSFHALTALPAAAVTCEERNFQGIPYTACTAIPGDDTLRLFLNDPAGDRFGQFSAINSTLEQEGRKLAFAMNGGMYHDDRSPVGHYIEDGEQVMRVIPNAGPGNFGLLPNGVFCIRDTRADVFETRDYMDAAPACVHATQSGPMLVIDGDLHPKFLPDSTSRHIRNGVGTDEDGQRVVFVISDVPVTFYEFGRIFRDDLNTPNALFLDGRVSRLYAPSLGRSDFGRWLGPIIGIVEPDS